MKHRPVDYDRQTFSLRWRCRALERRSVDSVDREPMEVLREFQLYYPK